MQLLKLLESSEIRQWDQACIQDEAIGSIDLMERAAMRLIEHLLRHVQQSERIVVLCGPGNNGGDGLAMTRLLLQSGYRCRAVVFREGHMSEDARVNLDRLRAAYPHQIEERRVEEGLALQQDTLVIDALFGTGLSRPLQSTWEELVKGLNQSEQKIISIDIPSGMPSEWPDNPIHWEAVNATLTLCIQIPKLSFFSEKGYSHTSEWEVVDIGLREHYKPKGRNNIHWIQRDEFLRKIPVRGRFHHKGHFGHACLHAGSEGMAGACIMAAKAALRTGSGLLSLLLDENILALAQLAVPQAMVIKSLKNNRKFQALASGPGIGKNPRARELLNQMIKLSKEGGFPLLLDADAINILAESGDWPTGKSVIYTPHPGEFERMCGVSDLSEEERYNKAREWVKWYPSYLLLKGGYSRVFTPEGREYIFSDGHPSLAKAGSGDLLSGIILALLAQGLHPSDAVCCGLIIHGGAARLASESYASMSVCYEDILMCIPTYLKSCGY